MKIIKSFILLFTGAAFGIGMVLSCGENSPNRSDAATCDCPASEAPISGRMITIDGQIITVQPGEQGVAGLTCDPGMQFISGSCTGANIASPADVTLQEAGFDKASSSWGCVFRNDKTVQVQVKASVLCLKPSM